MIKLSNLFISLRYINFSSKDTIAKISFISLLSIIVGVGTSIVVLSITNGFREDLKNKMIGKDAHIVVIGRGLGISNYDIVTKDLKQFPWVLEAEPYYQGQGLLRQYGDLIQGTLITGITTNALKRYKENFKLLYGSYELKKGEILLAETIAYNVGASVGREIEVIVKPPVEGTLPVIRKFRVKGIFSTGYGDFDSVLSVMLLEDAQKLFGVGNIAYGINVMVDDVDKVKYYANVIFNRYGGLFIVYTWQDLKRNLFEAMYNQKTVMMLILFLFFVVVSFGIIGTMMSMTLDKKSEIAILKAIGLRSRDVLQVFVIDGVILGLLGSIIGSVIGIIITINLETITFAIEDFVNFLLYNFSYPIAKFFNPKVMYPEKFEFFKSNVYYIKSFPTKLEFVDVFFVSVFATFVSTVAAIVPALRASNMKPAEILRND